MEIFLDGYATPKLTPHEIYFFKLKKANNNYGVLLVTINVGAVMQEYIHVCIYNIIYFNSHAYTIHETLRPIK